MIVDKIIQHLNQKSVDAKMSGDVFNPIRASNSGKCARQLAYAYHGEAGEPLNARAQLVFELGKMVEDQLVGVSKNIESLDLRDEQKEVSLVIGGKEIFGHIDGVMTIENTDKMLDAIIDFKSTTDHSFRSAQKGELDYGYKCQLNFYMKAAKFKHAVVVFYKKHTSHLCEVLLKYDQKIMDEIEQRFLKVFESTPDNLPEGEYGENEKGNLPWQCSYCSYVTKCKPDFKLTFGGDGKPVLKKIPN